MKRSNVQAAESVSRGDETGESLGAITGSVNTITDINARIAQSTQQQVGVFTALSQNMQANIQQFSQLSSTSAQQSRHAGVQLGDAVAQLQKFVGAYKVDGQDHIQLHTAKYAHLAWKTRVRGFLDGTSTLTRDEVLSHLHCEFGKWYHSEDAEEYRHIPEMQAIDKPHEELHRVIAEIVQLKEQGRGDEAEALFAKIDALSSEIVGLIAKVELHLGIAVESEGSRKDESAQTVDDVLF